MPKFNVIKQRWGYTLHKVSLEHQLRDHFLRVNAQMCNLTKQKTDA